MLGLLGSSWRPVRQRRRDTVDLTWLSARSWTARWYPQGIDIGSWRGRRTLAVSWFRQDRTGRHFASRVTLIDLARSRRVDVSLVFEDEDGVLQPARIHTGGIAWFGDRLFAAATGQGIWEFGLADVREVRGADARRVVGSSGRGLRAVALVAVRTRVHPIPLRCSFIGRAFDEDGTSLPRVLIGEYRVEDDGRIGEFSVPGRADEEFSKLRTASPGIDEMQGAVRWGEHHLVSQSRGLARGRLWSGSAETLTPHAVALPVGCEDLALDPEARLLWTLGEHPWRRVVRGIPFASLGI